MRKIRNYFLLLLSPIFIMIGLLTAGQTVSATSGNELTNVITDISLWDVNNGETLRDRKSVV